MLKQVVVFGNRISEDIIGNIIEDNLPVDVIKLENGRVEQETESEIRIQVDRRLSPYVGKVDLIILCDPEITLSSLQFLKCKYPGQEFVGYGYNLAGAIKKERRVRVLLPHIAKRMLYYQKMKSECVGVDISEGEYDFEEYKDQNFIERFLEGFANGLVIVYTPVLFHLERQLRARVSWRANVIDMRDSLLRDTCKALKLRGLDGGLARDVKG